MTAAALHELVSSTASMSAVPAFWQRSAASLGSPPSPRELHLEELTTIVFAWLYDAVTWNPPIESQISAPMTSRCQERQEPTGPRLPVRLHIYDVSHEEAVIQINQVFARKDSPVKFGGAFHVGVEVNGLEWCYGLSENDCKPGVACLMPRRHPCHHYRQTVFLGKTVLNAEDIAALISDLIEEWPGQDYDLLSRNCCHFADEFCVRLGVGNIPGWIHRFADIGTHLVGILQTASSIKSQVNGVLRQAKRELHQPIHRNSCWQDTRGHDVIEVASF